MELNCRRLEESLCLLLEKQSKADKKASFLKMRQDRALEDLKKKWDPVVALTVLGDGMEPADLKKIMPASIKDEAAIAKRVAAKLEKGNRADPKDLMALVLLYKM